MENHPCFRNFRGVHSGPRLYPWGTTPGFAETYRRGMGWQDQDSDGSSSEEDGEDTHKNWWRCGTCQGFWRSTGKIGWDENQFEEDRNREGGRLQKTCENCKGTLWKPEYVDPWNPRSPSPTGQLRIQKERWIFTGMDAPLWEEGPFRISMLQWEGEPAMSSGDEPQESEPPEYQTPTEDEMDMTQPRTPHPQSQDLVSTEAWRAFTQGEETPPDAYWSGPQEREGSPTVIDLRESTPVFLLPAPPVGPPPPAPQAPWEGPGPTSGALVPLPQQPPSPPRDLRPASHRPGFRPDATSDRATPIPDNGFIQYLGEYVQTLSGGLKV